MLELKNISFSVTDDAKHKSKEILKNVSLTVDEDSFVVITGPNGGGKSTLAKIIMGIEKPTSGRILFRAGYSLSLTSMSVPILGSALPFSSRSGSKG